jgi:CheY-like chemotaxis protein
MASLLDTLLEIAPGPIAVVDPGGRVIRSNPAFARVSGSPGQGVFTALVGKDQQPAASRLLAEGGSAELLLVSDGGPPRSVAFTARRLDDGSMLLAGVDLSEQRELESRIVRARKGESLARLSRGVAHDFNNALAAVMSYAELLLMDYEPDDPRRADVETIREAAVRASELTRQILVFSRSRQYQSRPVDLNALVLGLDKMLRRLIGEDVELVTLLGEDLGHAAADPGEVEAEIVDGVVRAGESIAHGGSITIQTGKTAQGMICLSLAWTGGGAPLVLELPPAASAPQPDAAPVPVRGTETIIVADDNDMVRRGISAMLSSRGFTVLPASSGEEAIHLARTHRGPLHLVLADVVMPRMTAQELDSRIREARPEARIMFMSGYADDAVSRGIVKPAGFIQKPFTAEGLARKVRDVLDG